jgi:hypothetical protein
VYCPGHFTSSILADPTEDKFQQSVSTILWITVKLLLMIVVMVSPNSRESSDRIKGLCMACLLARGITVLFMPHWTYESDRDKLLIKDDGQQVETNINIKKAEVIYDTLVFLSLNKFFARICVVTLLLVGLSSTQGN